MSSIVGAITGGGGKGAGWSAQGGDVTQFVDKAQTDAAFKNTQDALAQQQSFLQAVQGQNGIGNQSDIYNQFGQIAQGQGPNPAQTQLANATGANVANQAALMAGQRGSSANPGLIARQAAMQGANTQQQAAGQAAGLQAQQSLAAMGQQANIAGQQVANQSGATNAYNQQALQGQGNLLNAGSAQNNANVANASQQNSANAAIQGAITGAQMNLIGNLTGAAGSAATGMPMGNAAGAAPVAKAEGGIVSGPKSKIGQHFHMLAKGGPVKALVSPGEKYLDPKDVQKVEKGANPMAVGEKIPGKPAVGGAKNSYANDTVSKTLQEGGIVLPRSVTQSKNPSKSAADFVAAVMKKQSLKKG